MNRYLESFADYISSNISELTVKVYVGAVRQFYKFMRNKGYKTEKEILDNINEQAISEFVEYIKSSKKGRSTINNIITGIRKFVEYLHDINRIPEEITISIFRQQSPKSHKRQFKLTVNPNDLPMPYKIMAMLIQNHNISPQKVANMKITDINFNTINVGYSRIILNKEEIKLLIQYLESRKHIENDYLFVRQDGTKISSYALDSVVKTR